MFYSLILYYVPIKAYWRCLAVPLIDVIYIADVVIINVRTVISTEVIRVIRVRRFLTSWDFKSQRPRIES